LDKSLRAWYHVGDMENQDYDWKREWKDDQLDDLCAFANTDGGTLEIGKDNRGQFFPLKNIPKLLEDLPNKIRQQLGIIARVESVTEDGNTFIRIQVKKYAYPISYRGHYYKRSGSTTVEITGHELDEFILRSQGRTWDAIPDPGVSVDDLSAAAFKAFRLKAVDSGRLTAEQANVSNELLLKNLKLIENGQLTRAAILLFHEDPSQYLMGAGIKIAYFTSKADFLYQDEINGALITLADKVEDIAYTKYFKGIVSYKGFQRIENFPVPRIAFREAVLNAIINKDYPSQSPIKIRVYDDRVEIYNCGRLPTGWTVDDLHSEHESRPFNTFIAGTIFRSGQVEAWGRGIEKINASLAMFGKRNVEYSTGPGFVITRFYAEGEPEGITDRVAPNGNGTVNGTVSGTVSGTVNGTVKLTPTQKLIYDCVARDASITADNIAEAIGKSLRTVKRGIRELQDLSIMKREGSDKTGSWVVLK